MKTSISQLISSLTFNENYLWATCCSFLVLLPHVKCDSSWDNYWKCDISSMLKKNKNTGRVTQNHKGFINKNVSGWSNRTLNMLSCDTEHMVQLQCVSVCVLLFHYVHFLNEVTLPFPSMTSTLFTLSHMMVTHTSGYVWVGVYVCVQTIRHPFCLCDLSITLWHSLQL